jgi:hypothetical protein
MPEAPSSVAWMTTVPLVTSRTRPSLVTVAIALLLSHVVRWNSPSAGEQYDELRAGDRASHGAMALRRMVTAEVLRQCLQALKHLRFETTVGKFLDAVREPAFEKASVEWRRFGVEQVPPLLLERGHRQGLECGQTAQNCVGQSKPPSLLRELA